MKQVIALLATLTTIACVSTPSAPPVRVSLADAPFAASSTASIAPLPDDWWRLYDDPDLDRLVHASLDANADLRVAFATLDSAQASATQARALRTPQTTIESSLRFDDRSDPPGTASLQTTDYDVAATLNWDMDLFGRLRSAALAARADASATAAAVDGVRVAIVSETVGAYLDYCGAVHSAAAVESAIAAQENLSATVRHQHAVGDLSLLEVAQAESTLAGLRATLPNFIAQRQNALYRLAELQGQAPARARDFSFDCKTFPRLEEPLPAGDGQALLLRRPDIREAERRLASATARIGVARADLYPRLVLGGAAGLLTGSFHAVATPFVSWSFPNQAAARARIAQAQAGERGALASWDATVLRALREVESAMTLLDQEARRNTQLQEALVQARLAARWTGSRVRLGDAAFFLLHEAERSSANARLALAQSDLMLARNQLALFRALGGGWQHQSTQTSSTAAAVVEP